MTPKNHRDQQDNIKKSIELLDWFNAFKHDGLVNLTKYAKVCDRKAKNSIDTLISECSTVESEILLVLNKNTWQTLSLERWNDINAGINNKLESIANKYEALLPQLESFEMSM